MESTNSGSPEKALRAFTDLLPKELQEGYYLIMEQGEIKESIESAGTCDMSYLLATTTRMGGRAEELRDLLDRMVKAKAYSQVKADKLDDAYDRYETALWDKVREALKESCGCGIV